MSKKEDNMTRLILELQFLQETASSIQTRIGLVNAAINDVQRAINTVEGLKKEKAGASLFVPIGGGSYIKAHVADASTLIVGVGANVATEKSVSETEESLNSRINSLMKANDALHKQFDEVAVRINKIRNRVQELSDRSSEGTANVRGIEEKPR